MQKIEGQNITLTFKACMSNSIAALELLAGTDISEVSDVVASLAITWTENAKP